MLSPLILLLTLLAYSVVVSQSYMYIIALKNVQQDMAASSYIELRQLLDKYFSARFKYIVYLVLIGNIALVGINLYQPDNLLLIASVISLLALLVDVVLATKRNIPINKIINEWTVDDYPENWMSYRSSWLRIFYYRQLATILGFVVLVSGSILHSR